MVAKTLIIIPKKREKKMISRMKFWCVRLRERGEIFTKKMENVVTNDQTVTIHKPLFHEIGNYRPWGRET
mgnify:CR=1 FL=1